MKKMLRILGKKGRITIPYEIRQRVGFACNDVLSFEESDDARTIIVKKEYLCDCGKNGREKWKDEEITLFEFLNGLSVEQQKAALVHLSVKWAEQQAEKEKKEM